jgi:DHA2 family multidrug resistance protein
VAGAAIMDEPAGAGVVMLHPSRMMLAGLVLALSNFMVVLDLTIANVSVPHIAGDLGITPDQGTWVITSYAVAEAICVPLTGWLAQRFGVVKMFVLAMVGFGLFSLLCGLSVSLTMLVACRVGQGLCGAPLMPMSQTLMMRVYPPEKRNMAVGIWAMTTLLGPALGPIIGGVISDNFSWHWIFLLNVPVAAACSVAAYAVLKPIETPTERRPIDVVGLCLLVFWISCLQIMLDTGRDHDWFGDPMEVLLAICAGVGFLAFLIWELTDEHPIVDLRVFRHRSFSLGVLTLTLCFGAYFASIVIIPQWLQGSLGYPATKAGIVTAFTAMAALLTSQFVAKLIGKVDARIMVSGGVAWLGCMALLRTQWTSGADFWTLALPQMLQGLGMAFFMIPLTSISLRAVPPEEMASAAGLQNFTRTMAIAVATALVLTEWSSAERTAHSQLASSLHTGPTMAALSGAGFKLEQARQMVAMLVEREALAVAVDHVFVLTACVLFVAAGIVWLAPAPKALDDA